MASGSFRIFRLFEIDVFVHWSWFLVAGWLIPIFGREHFSSVGWSAVLYVLLFGVVLLHEFGHALACRSVGGRVEMILLSPLGGAAYMQTPQTPRAVLWSIVAGPLVNVVLVPLTAGAYLLARGSVAMPVPGNDVQVFLGFLFAMNLFLLVYNMLPIYPMDGGQALMALLWPAVGRPQAMRTVGIIGLVVAGLVTIVAAVIGNIVILLLTLFMAWRAWVGYQVGTQMLKTDPRKYDDRYQENDVERRITEQIDPWRR